MRRIMLVTAYDGTDYCGFQIQNNGITVQGVLNSVLSEWLSEDIKTSGASRTDAGVHSRCNIVVFDTGSQIPGDKYAFGLNARLPEDIRIRHSCEVSPDFRPRSARTVKTYAYRIQNGRFQDPIIRRDHYFCHWDLDIDAMRSAARALTGTHDFESFAAVGHSSLTTVRTIYDIKINREGELITITVTGDGFLYNMVRIIAGTLMEIGKGNIPADAVPAMLEACSRDAAGPTAPACGLTLERIDYPDYDFEY